MLEPAGLSDADRRSGLVYMNICACRVWLVLKSAENRPGSIHAQPLGRLWLLNS